MAAAGIEEFVTEFLPNQSARTESLEGKKSFTPLNRYGEITDVVRAVNYLEDSDFVTGEISYIDGGRTAGH